MKLLLGNKQAKIEMRITKISPDHDWATIWSNVHIAPVSATTKGEWYRIIHDLIPTNERLHKIRLSQRDRCNLCNEQDTLRHRVTECGEEKRKCDWTSNKMAMILRMDPRYIPQEWIMIPQFRLWPPQKHRAIVWFIAHIALYRGQQRRELTHNDFMDFLMRHKRYMYQQPKRTETDRELSKLS
jgi:hypothetical protein